LQEAYHAKTSVRLMRDRAYWGGVIATLEGTFNRGGRESADGEGSK